jgi:hypothetical protein
LTCQWKGGNQCSRDDPDGGTDSRGEGTSNYGGSDGPSWWSGHYREIIIGLAVGIGGSVLLAFFVCIIASCRRRRQQTVPVQEVRDSG